LFKLTAEAVGAGGERLGRRTVTLVGTSTGEPLPPREPDVPAALAAALEARELLPGDPAAARVKLDTVIDLLG
jgi:hypothetical protein